MPLPGVRLYSDPHIMFLEWDPLKRKALNKLIIDIGNTLSKVAVFQDEKLTKLWVGAEVSPKVLEDLLRGYPLRKGIVSTVRKHDKTMGLLRSMGLDPILAGPHLKHPLRMGYRSPETLGSDRLAAAIAGHHLFPNKNVLVVNVGSCLTTDMVSDAGEYLGGSIAPGLQMRFNALHIFSGKLPQVDYGHRSDQTGPGETKVSGSRAGSHNLKPAMKNSLRPAGESAIPNLPGQTTQESIQAGVVCGMLAEIDGLIEQYNNKLRLFKVILSGGDIKVFDKKLKNRIFAVENIVLHGLNQMLKHNA